MGAVGYDQVPGGRKLGIVGQIRQTQRRATAALDHPEG